MDLCPKGTLKNSAYKNWLVMEKHFYHYLLKLTENLMKLRTTIHFHILWMIWNKNIYSSWSSFIHFKKFFFFFFKMQTISTIKWHSWTIFKENNAISMISIPIIYSWNMSLNCFFKESELKTISLILVGFKYIRILVSSEKKNCIRISRI